MIGNQNSQQYTGSQQDSQIGGAAEKRILRIEDAHANACAEAAAEDVALTKKKYVI